jgi:hypothetical protein
MPKLAGTAGESADARANRFPRSFLVVLLACAVETPKELAHKGRHTACYLQSAANGAEVINLSAFVVSEEALLSWRFLCPAEWTLNGPVTAQSTANSNDIAPVSAPCACWLVPL